MNIKNARSLQTLFRFLVVLSPAIQATGLAHRWFAELHVTEDWKTLLQGDRDGGWLSAEMIENIPFWLDTGIIVAIISCIAGHLVSLVGLFLFRNWARHANLCFLSLLTIVTPFLGLTVALPFESFCGTVAGIADGAIIAIAYFSPVRRKFNRTRPV